MAARAVREWTDGTEPGRPDTDVEIPYVEHLPDHPTGRGHWLALELHLNPDTTWLHFPQGVAWPEEVGTLVTDAFPEFGDRFIALRQTDVYERAR